MIHFVEVLTLTSQNTEVTTSTNLVIEVTPSIRSICRSYNFDKINYRSYLCEGGAFSSMVVTLTIPRMTTKNPQGYYAYNQISRAPGVATLLAENIPYEAPKSLREIARLQSVTGGEGMLRCDCKGGCKTKRCKCKQANVLCNSRCHHSSTCDNK